MFKLFSLVFKVVVFSAAILVLGHYLTWEGKTLSDQVRLQLSHAERSPVAARVKKWTNGLMNDAVSGSKSQKSQKDGEEVPPSERQKLRALIRELNRSR
jgi:hypothetical protein